MEPLSERNNRLIFPNKVSVKIVCLFKLRVMIYKVFNISSGLISSLSCYISNVKPTTTKSNKTETMEISSLKSHTAVFRTHIGHVGI